MPKVIHVTTIDLTISILLLPFLRDLQSRGYQVCATCKFDRGRSDIEAQGITARNIRHLTRQFTPARDFLALLELYFLFCRECPDIVHTHTPKANLLGCIAARLAGVPIVINMEHGFYFLNMSGLSRAFYIAISRCGSYLSNKTIVINHHDFELALQEKIVEKDKLVLSPSGLGVNLDRFSPEVNYGELKSKINIGDDVTVIIFVGRLNPEKGCRELLQATQIVNSLFPNICLVMAGSSEYGMKEELQVLASVLDITGKVRFVGERRDIPELIAMADMLVLPSYREGLATVLIEAAAVGKPAVTTDVRGCRDVIVHGETGLLVPPGDVQELAEAILDMLQNVNKRKRMGEAARQRAEKKFNQRLFFDQMDDLYQHLLREKGILT